MFFYFSISTPIIQMVHPNSDRDRLVAGCFVCSSASECEWHWYF